MPEAVTEDHDPEQSVEDSKQSKLLALLISVDSKELKKEKPAKAPTKVVVRRLPPRYTKELFLSDFALPPYDSLYFVRGDLALGQHSFSRAYVNFVRAADVYQFRDKFDDFLLNDDQGKEYRAVVEFAPNQKVARQVKRKSSKSGNLDEDPKYVEFMEKLEQEKNNPASVSSYFYETEGYTSAKELAKQITTTPLLEFMKMKKQRKIDMRNELRQKKEKEKRRREEKIEISQKVEKEEPAEEEKQGEEEETKKQQPPSRGKKWDTKPRIFVQKEIKREDKRKFENEKPKDEKKPKERFFKNYDYERTKQPRNRKQDTRIITSSNQKSPSESKSKFRYSEQRNRNAAKQEKKSETPAVEVESKEKEAEKKEEKKSMLTTTGVEPQRCKSLETSDEKEDKEHVIKRSLSLDEDDEKNGGGEQGKKDPRTSRRIPNKERPAMEIYRPGMGKFSKQRLESKPEKSEGDEKAGSE